MDLSPASLMASLVVGSIGLGLFIFGKKQGRVLHFAVGLALMGLPYFVPAAAPMLASTAALVGGLVLVGRLAG